MTNIYTVKAWASPRYWAETDIEADTPEAALAAAREELKRHPGEPCGDVMPWDEFTVEDADGQEVHAWPGAPSFTFEHRLPDLPDRCFVDVDGKYSIAIIRNEHGLVVDVCPKDWDFPIDTFTVWDDDVTAATEDDTDEDQQPAEEGATA